MMGKMTLAILVVVLLVGLCTPEKGCDEPCATAYGYACNNATGECVCDDQLCQAASPSCAYANGNNFGQYCMQENEGVKMESCCVPTAGLVCDDVNECLWNYWEGLWLGARNRSWSGHYKAGESTCVCCEDEYKCDPTKGGCQCRDDLCANRVSCGKCDGNNHCVTTCTSTQRCADDGGTETCKCIESVCNNEQCGSCDSSTQACNPNGKCDPGQTCDSSGVN